MACATLTRPMDISPVLETPCHLLQLPDEVKLEIVKHVHRRRDLYNFSLACRSLEDMTLSKLYRSIDLDVPSSNAPCWSQESLPVFRPYVLQNMRELAIRNGLSDAKNPVYHKRRRSDANTVEGYVSDIFRGVPHDRLKAFSFQHQKPLNGTMIEGLTRQHGSGLKHLHCCEFELDNLQMLLPSSLRSLECRSVSSGESIARLITNNRRSLKHLSLGQDKHLIQRYRERRIGFLNNVQQPLPSFYSALDLSAISNLTSLSLSGLDLDPLVPQDIESALFLTRLKSLTLESCPNTAPFLEALASTFTRVQSLSSCDPNEQIPQISLKKFSFRHEFFTTPVRDALVRFLTSFTGLVSLTLLVENTTFTARPSTFLTPHSSTLETLVLESRVQPREHLEIDTSRPFGATNATSSSSQRWSDMMTDIATLCPNLVELGTAFPWTDTVVQEATFQLGQALKLLRTLHVRNFPTYQTTCQCSSDDTTILLDHATQFLHWLRPVSAAFETLAIGPTLYSSRWRLSVSGTTGPAVATSQVRPVHSSLLHGSPVPSSEPLPQSVVADQEKSKRHDNPNSPPPHLCTHYFVTEPGWVSGVKPTSVSERQVEESRSCKETRHGSGAGLGGCFETVWLR